MSLSHRLLTLALASAAASCQADVEQSVSALEPSPVVTVTSGRRVARLESHDPTLEQKERALLEAAQLESTRIHGVARNAEGATIEGASVRLVQLIGAHPRVLARTKTDASGHYSIPAHSVPQLARLATLGIPLLIEADAPGHSVAKRTLEVTSDSLGARADLPLERGFSLRGRMLDDAGKAVAHGWVEIHWAGRGSAITFTDQDGFFVAPLTLASDAAIERIELGRYDIGRKVAKKLPTGTRDVDLGDVTLDVESVAEGSILSPNGEALPNVEVIFAATNNPSRNRRVIRSDADGRFRAASLKPVEYIVYTETGGKMREATRTQPPARHIALESDARRIVVRVTDENRAPIAGLPLHALVTHASDGMTRGIPYDQPLCTTDHDGFVVVDPTSLTIIPALESTWQLALVSSNGAFRTLIQVPAERPVVRDEFQIVLDEVPISTAPDEGGRLRLHVDGVAAGTAEVTYAPVGTAAMDAFARLGFHDSDATLDAEMTFGIPLGEARVSANVLPAGSYLLRVESDGLAPQTFEIEVRSGEISDARVELR